jgi:hypothetical protein
VLSYLKNLLDPNGGAPALGFVLVVLLSVAMGYQPSLSKGAVSLVFSVPVAMSAKVQAFDWRGNGHDWPAYRFENILSSSAIMASVSAVIGIVAFIIGIDQLFGRSISREVSAAHIGFGLASIYESGVIIDRMFLFASYGKVQANHSSVYGPLLVVIFTIIGWLLKKYYERQLMRVLNARSETTFVDYVEQIMQPYPPVKFGALRWEWLWQALCGIGTMFGAATGFVSSRYYKRGQ